MSNSHTIHSFDNGLRLVLDPIEGLKTFALSVVIHGGTRFETKAQSGFAHLLEHMVFKGAGGRDALQLATAIESKGGSINAATGYEHTRFEVRGLTALLPLALSLVSDLLFRAHLEADDLKKELKVIAQEISEAYDTPDDHVFDCLQAAMYGDTALGRPILGTVQSLKPVTPDGLRDFYHGLYAPDRMVVALSGGFEPNEARDLVQAYFSPKAIIKALSLPETTRFLAGQKKQHRAIEQVNLTLGFEAFSRYDEALPALRLYGEILGGGMASRLFQEAREIRGLAYTIDAFVTPYRDCGMLGIYAGCAQDDVAGLLDLIDEVLKKMPESLNGDELERAKAQFITGLCLGEESAAARANSLATQVSVFDRIFSLDEQMAQIDGVDLTALKAVAERFSLDAPHALALLGPI